jgi:hypothetical protein
LLDERASVLVQQALPVSRHRTGRAGAVPGLAIEACRVGMIADLG